MSKLVFLRKTGFGTSLDENGFDTIKPNQERKFRRLNPDIIWRWGYSGTVNYRLTSDQISRLKFINIPAAITRVGNKYEFLKQCSQNDIRVPEILDYDNYTYPENETWLGRKFSHFGGRDIKVITNGEQYESSDSDYLVKFVPKQREYRIYTFFGKIVNVQEKIPEDKEQIAWNHSQGSHFENVRWNDWPKKACWFAIKCALLTNINFCAWDIILGKDNKFYVLEGNTAPSITGEYNLSILSVMIEYICDTFDKKHALPTTYELGEYNSSDNYRKYIHPFMLEEE